MLRHFYIAFGKGAVKSRKSFLFAQPRNWEKNQCECKPSYLNPSYLHAPSYTHLFIPQASIVFVQKYVVILYLRDFIVFSRCH